MRVGEDDVVRDCTAAAECHTVIPAARRRDGRRSRFRGDAGDCFFADGW